MFAGCGGGDLGFKGGFAYLREDYERLPFSISWANDIDPFARTVYTANLNDEIADSDITAVKFESLELGTIDVLLAGLPCQDFAMLGPRGGLHSKRGQLYKHVRRALRALSPRIFIVENVPGIEHPPKMLGTIARCLAGRTSPRYHLKVHRINTADYGVPQIRKRVVIVGTRSDLTTEFEEPMAVCADPKQADDTNLRPWRTAKDALDDLWSGDGPETSAVADQSKVTHAAIILDKPKRSDKRLDADEPAPTIRAEHHGHVELHYRRQADGSFRHLTVRECARLQGFPDSFEFPVSFTQGYRQIGNAIPPVLMHHWAKSILRWLGTQDTVEARRLSPRDPATTSRIMSAVRNRGSRAELALAKAMWSAGLRYRKHPRGLPGKPDYVFPSVKVAVFCDGDFWHGRSWRLRGFRTWDEQFDRIARSDFWRLKIRRNMERDEEVRRALESSGWTVLRIAESEILDDPTKCAETVRMTVFNRRTPVRAGLSDRDR